MDALASGTLSRWDDDRGFGFISPAAGWGTVFVHISAFPRGARRPVVGDTVSYRVETTAEGKTRAAGVQYFGAAGVSNGPSARFRSRSGSYVVVVAFVALLVAAVVAWEPPLWIPGLYLGASLVCFVAYAADKAAARNGGWRVSEGSLLVLGLIGGWPGALIAQQRLRHKTIKPSFRFAFWVTVLVNIGAFILISAPGLWEVFIQLLV
jgi:uncharacterized membrane protein YsdA (DUF1294 family)/cold shock CspA family protein